MFSGTEVSLAIPQVLSMFIIVDLSLGHGTDGLFDPQLASVTFGQTPTEDGTPLFDTPGTDPIEIMFVERMPKLEGNIDSTEAVGPISIEMIDG